MTFLRINLRNTCVLEKGAGLLIPAFFFFAAFVVFAPAIYRPSIFQVMGGDVYHNLWIWGRNIANVKSGLAPYAPNIFFPDAMSSFYSEMEVGNSIVYGLLSTIGLHPICAYSVIVILAFALTGIMVALIARRLGASTSSAILGGAIVAFASYRYSHLAHVQLLSTYWMLIPLYFALSYLLDGARRHLVLTGLAHIPMFFGPSYNLVGLFFLETAIFIAFIFNSAVAFDLRLRRASALGCVVGFALLLALPCWWNYLDLFKAGMNRDGTLAPHAMDLSSFFIPANGSLIYRYVSNWVESSGQQQLSINSFFLGFVALWAIVTALSHRAPVSGAKSNGVESHHYLRAMYWSGLVMLALSLGEVILWHKLYVLPNPIFKLAQKLHLLSATRYIAHYAYFALIAFSVIVACHFRNFPQNVASATRFKLHLGLAILVILENFTVYHGNLSMMPKKPASQPAVYKYLAQLPSGQGVVFLPLPTGNSNVDKIYLRQFEYMFNAQYHHLRMFNGISGFFPLHYTQGLGLFAEFPNYPGLNFILTNQIDYVVHDKNSGRVMDFSKQKMALLCEAIVLIYSDQDYDVYKVDRIRGAECVKNAGNAALAQWVFIASTATPHQIGYFDASNNAMVSKLGEQGALAFGPYIELEKGRYRATFTLDANGDSSVVEAGAVDVNGYNDGGTGKIYGKLPISLDSKKQEISIEFYVTDPSLRHEFRVWSNGTAKINFFKVSISKI